MAQVIGVTGLPCAGKGEVVRFLQGLGASAVHMDQIGHAILNSDAVRPALQSRFGEDLIPDCGPIDRRKLGRHVFTDLTALNALEAILHPPMQAAVRDAVGRLLEQGSVVIDGALLGKLSFVPLCDRVIIVEAPLELRVARAAARGWDESTLLTRDKRLEEEMKSSRVRADEVIVNDGSLTNLQTTVSERWKEWTHAP